MREPKKKVGKAEGGSPGGGKSARPRAPKNPTLNIQQTEVKETVIIETLPPKTNMEVHHHPEVEKKGFKEYILEGLMIFLAVTMGFFAESLREHINERDRAGEFAVTLYSDLKADTAELHEYLTYTKKAVSNIDTLMQLLSDNDPKHVSSGKLYWFGLWGGAYRVFIPHDATLLEMKNSGSLRYFADLSLNRNLAQYDQLCQNLRAIENLNSGIYIEVRKIRAQLFSYKYNAIINDISHIKDAKIRQAAIDSFIKTDPPLLNTDRVLFNQYVEMVRSRFLDRNLISADTILNHANTLISVLKKKYELDEE